MYINLVAQATEDCDRLVAQIARNLGLGDVTTLTEIQYLSGHYGNTIAYVKIDVPEHRSEKILRKTI
ncbi:MAG: RNA-binding domain-containing protein, partial [Candidatus Geothermarchaeales archaeon]